MLRWCTCKGCIAEAKDVKGRLVSRSTAWRHGKLHGHYQGEDELGDEPSNMPTTQKTQNAEDVSSSRRKPQRHQGGGVPTPTELGTFFVSSFPPLSSPTSLLVIPLPGRGLRLVQGSQPAVLRIDACPNDHVLFYNSPVDAEYQYALLNACPCCHAARFTPGPGPRQPVKQMFYFSLQVSLLVLPSFCLPCPEWRRTVCVCVCACTSQTLLEGVFCQPDFVRSFSRTATGGIPRGRKQRDDPGAPINNITESDGFDEAVHRQDPRFGKEFRNICLQLSSDGFELFDNNLLWPTVSMVLNASPE
jgi:hypothetical protein